MPAAFGGTCACEGGCLVRAVGGVELDFERLAEQRHSEDETHPLMRAAFGDEDSEEDFFQTTSAELSGF